MALRRSSGAVHYSSCLASRERANLVDPSNPSQIVGVGSSSLSGGVAGVRQRVGVN